MVALCITERDIFHAFDYNTTMGIKRIIRIKPLLLRLQMTPELVLFYWYLKERRKFDIAYFCKCEIWFDVPRSRLSIYLSIFFKKNKWPLIALDITK